MLNTHGYVSLGPYLCITVVVPANNDFRRKKLPENRSDNESLSFRSITKIAAIHNPHTTQKMTDRKQVVCRVVDHNYFDLWPPKSIEFNASPWLTCLPSSMKKHTWFSLKCVHKLISIHVNCDLDLWPLTSKIKRVHPLTMANMYAKFDEKARFSLVSILFTSLFPYLSIVTLTFDLQNQ